MATLSQTRADIAAALGTVAAFKFYARQPKAVRPGDGWVAYGAVAPWDFTRCVATFQAVVVLHGDQVQAETLFEQNATALINALTSTLNVSEVSMEPQILTVGDQNPTSYFCLVMTFNLEVD